MALHNYFKLSCLRQVQCLNCGSINFQTLCNEMFMTENKIIFRFYLQNVIVTYCENTSSILELIIHMFILSFGINHEQYIFCGYYSLTETVEIKFNKETYLSADYLSAGLHRCSLSGF